jgi:L-asparaginase/Glu-tRNA(Gln) amidotransferase subunit D
MRNAASGWHLNSLPRMHSFFTVSGYEKSIVAVCLASKKSTTSRQSFSSHGYPKIGDIVIMNKRQQLFPRRVQEATSHFNSIHNAAVDIIVAGPKYKDHAKFLTRDDI